MSFPSSQWGGESKGLEMGKKIKIEKKRKFGENVIMAVPNHKNWLVKHILTLFKLLIHYFIALVEKKIKDFVAGKKIKSRGNQKRLNFIHPWNLVKNAFT